MHILNLLEADAYRYQPSWLDNEQPVIHMKGRESRSSNSSPGSAYGFQYGMEALGIHCPRRWRSTFATTNLTDSMFIEDVEGDGDISTGLRKIIIGSDQPVGTVKNDFNAHNFVDYAADVHHMMMELSRVLESKAGNKPDAMELVNAANSWMDSHGQYSIDRIGTDQGYDAFKQLVALFDKIMMRDEIPPQLVDHNILQHGSLKASLQSDIQSALNSGKVKVFASIDSVPTDRGYEIWFEGDYQAELLTQEQLAAIYGDE